jgi:hypothetical protein
MCHGEGWRAGGRPGEELHLHQLYGTCPSLFFVRALSLYVQNFVICSSAEKAKNKNKK